MSGCRIEPRSLGSNTHAVVEISTDNYFGDGPHLNAKKKFIRHCNCGRDHSRPPVVKVKVNDGRAKYLFGEDSGRNAAARNAATGMEWKW